MSGRGPRHRGSAGAGAHAHPAHVTWHDMYKRLNIEKNDRVTREDWALVLRRHIGVLQRRTLEHLNGGSGA